MKLKKNLEIYRNKMEKELKEKLDEIIGLLKEIADNTEGYT